MPSGSDGAWTGFLARWRDGAAERERSHELLFEAVDELRALRFGAVRLPVARGGQGASPSALLELLAELARRDSACAQLLRATSLASWGDMGETRGDIR